MIALSHRERVLAAAVGGIAFAFANVVLVNLFVEERGQLTRQLKSKTQELSAMRMMARQKQVWDRRDAWLRSKQPKLDSEDSAGVQLLNQIQDAARKYQVLLDHPAISSADRRADCISISVQLETKSSWRAIIAFLHALQSPEQFIVFENANLKIDDADHSQMRGQFKIARWYATPLIAKTTPHTP